MLLRTLGALLLALGLAATPAVGQKPGGTLRIYNTSNPPSASPHEDTTIAVVMPFMAVYNNLVRYDPIKPRNSFDTIIPELATSWDWDATKTKLTFKLRSDVTWHDGKPFTGKDVQCTFHRLNGQEPEYLRRNPRGIWYEHLTEVTLNGDYEVTFVLSQPQPSLLAMLASGYTAVYPCHVSGRDMRVKPVGTGPFKFVEFKSNESIRLVKNPDYWKKGQPYLDAIEWRIVPSRSTRILAFAAGEATGKVATRAFNTFRAPAVILVDQLSKIHFDAELDVVESSLWYNRLFKKDYSVALNLAGAGIDDPDGVLKMGFACKSDAN